MAFSAQELANIANSTLETYLNKGKVFKQNVANKPMMRAFDESRGQFPGGKERVSITIKSGQGGGSLAGYSHDDAVNYYNPASQKRASYAWREHHIGLGITHTELKTDGIDVDDSGSTSSMEGREKQALANLLDEKNDDLGEDYSKGLDALLHGDGSGDAKAIAGIQALLLTVPNAGSTGGINRATNAYWRNRAATAAFGTAGGQDAITSNVANGGALLQFLQGEFRQLNRYAQGGTKHRLFAGSDFIDAVETELRANGNYTLSGFMRKEAVDGGMGEVYFKGKLIEYDPTLDELSLEKRMYVIDMRRIRLMYMNGQRMKKHTPARPYNRYVMYNGITTTGALIAQQLNTSAVYDIA